MLFRATSAAVYIADHHERRVANRLETMGLGAVHWPGPTFAINDAGRVALEEAAPKDNSCQECGGGFGHCLSCMPDCACVTCARIREANARLESPRSIGEVAADRRLTALVGGPTTLESIQQASDRLRGDELSRKPPPR